MKAIQCHGTLLNLAIYHETLATSDRCDILMKHRSASIRRPYMRLFHTMNSFTSLKANPRELKNIAHNSDHTKTHLKCILPILQEPETTSNPNPNEKKKHTHTRTNQSHLRLFMTKSDITYITQKSFLQNIRYHKRNPIPKFLLPPNSYTAHTYMNTYILSSKPVRTSTYIRTYGQNRNRGPWGGKTPSSHHHHHQGTRMDLHTYYKKVPSPYIFVRAQMIRTVGCFADSAIRCRIE